MITRGPSHKQIIVPMGKENTNKFMASSSSHIANINRAFKNIKLDIMADYVWQEPISVTIVTNKVALPYNLQVIKNSNVLISSEFIELIIKSNHIFNSLSLVSKL